MLMLCVTNGETNMTLTNLETQWLVDCWRNSCILEWSPCRRNGNSSACYQSVCVQYHVWNTSSESIGGTRYFYNDTTLLNLQLIALDIHERFPESLKPDPQWVIVTTLKWAQQSIHCRTTASCTATIPVSILPILPCPHHLLLQVDICRAPAP